MRWPRPLLPLLFSHPISTSTSNSLSLADDLISSLPYLSSLRHLDPFLNRHIITEALFSLSSPLPAFRLYLLASYRRRLGSFNSFDRMVSLFLKHPDSLPQALDFIKVKYDDQHYVPPGAFEPVIAAYVRTGQVEKAIEVFERMIPDFDCPPNLRVYGILLKMFMENGLVVLAMALYNQMLMSNSSPGRSNYLIVMDGLCKTGMVEDALQLFDEMLERGVYPDARVYNVIITSLCRAGKFDDVARLLQLMKEKECGPREADFNSVISGLCRLGRINDAFAQLAVFQEEGFVIGLEGHSSLIDGLFKAGMFNEACQYFRKILNEDVKPDSIIYTTMIKGYADAGQVEECFSLLDEMTDRGLAPDVFCFNTVIKALCDGGQLDRARSLQLEISKNNLVPDRATYTIMLRGFCNAGMVDEAQKIFDEMSNLGIQPSIHSYNSLVNGLCKAGRMKQAQLLLYKMEMGRNPFLFLRLSQGTNQIRDSAGLRKQVNELCQSGQILKAYKLVHGILNSGVMPDVIIYNTLINGFCKNGDIDGALKLFKELQIKGYSPDEYTYCTLINGLYKAHRDEDANKLFQHLVQTGFKLTVSIYYQVMKWLGRKKMVGQAVMLWLDYLAQECTEVEALNAISDVTKHFENGSLEEAVRGLLELDRVHGSVGPDPYTIWLTSFCIAGRVNDAFTIYTLLREYSIDLTPASCCILIDRLCLTNNLGWSVHLVLYSIKKRFLLFYKKGIDRLIQRLCVQNQRPLAQVLISRLCVAGYNLDNYITKSTKQLLLKSEEELVQLKICRG
ncbi:Pentatricopeptide repeat-containing protein [Rhynchospora pubera]|uniref:Pentatricopeptide repeat-containing protein n=1 Tax=Rhynchospora pubera TaxID=906938 RepID=A0AAV8FM32_9POAL|nr:Pentatricopeptide repeat-containing protein [Rhynchospora pubera]